MGVDLPDGAVDRLADFAALLEERGAVLGVVGPSEGARIIDRHILDCLRAAPHARGPECLDLGSGGGLPGLVLAIARPDLQICVIDRRSRKVGFVELAEERLGLRNVSCLLGEIEDLDLLVPCATARALAPVEKSWELAKPLLAEGGRLIYFAGKGFEGLPAHMEGVSCETVPPAVLELSGPLAIMTRN